MSRACRECGSRVDISTPSDSMKSHDGSYPLNHGCVVTSRPETPTPAQTGTPPADRPADRVLAKPASWLD